MWQYAAWSFLHAENRDIEKNSETYYNKKLSQIMPYMIVRKEGLSIVATWIEEEFIL